MFGVGRHAMRHEDGDVRRLHLNKGDLLEARGFSRTNLMKYPKDDVMEFQFYGRKVYLDKRLFEEDCGVKVPEEKPMEEKISEEKIINKPEIKEESTGKPKDAMEFIKQFKQQQGESVDDFLAEMDRTSNLPYKMSYIGKKFGANKVYEITFKETGKTIYGVEAKKYGEDVFIKIEVNDEGQMYQDCYVDQYGEKIE